MAVAVLGGACAGCACWQPCLTATRMCALCLLTCSRTRDGWSLVEERDEMPSLREVSLEVLPRAAAAAASARR